MSDIYTDPKPEDTRCRFCFGNGTCDRVAFRFGWCGLARLVDAIDTGPMQVKEGR